MHAGLDWSNFQPTLTPELATRYRTFVETWSFVLDSLADLRARKERLPDTAFLPGALAMAVAFQDVFDDDPLLPPELLPPDDWHLDSVAELGGAMTADRRSRPRDRSGTHW